MDGWLLEQAWRLASVLQAASGAFRRPLSARRQTTGVASGAVEQSTWRSRSSRRLDARGGRPPASAKTSAGLFSTASRRTASVCHIEEGSPKTSLVRLCLRLFSSHKVHRAHSRAPAVCKGQPLCQNCCADQSLNLSEHPHRTTAVPVLLPTASCAHGSSERCRR